ncbi:MAG: DUF4261 domain-containing protein [Sutterellaceae bacterium]|nr:DUF4261 domain-containing protein [Sutterellaceae bacterium]MDD7442375.1 DUF4261 domain-containing protein [Sutterellaceae bacterium]MDY2867119.1 DUF4261 domain-containing protein [Mesosutterella sp.]
MTETKQKRGPALITTVLLSEPKFSAKQYAQNLRADWGIEIPETDIGEENMSVVTLLRGMMVSVFLDPTPVPDGKAEREAQTNYLWKEAVKTAAAHKARVTVAIQLNGTDPVGAAVLSVKLAASVLRQASASGVMACGTVMSPEFYLQSALEGCAGNRIPIMNLIYFGVYSNDNGSTMNGYTFGMKKLGAEELEILGSLKEPQEIFQMLTTAASYMIDYRVKLRDGDTIGLRPGESFRITESRGQAVDGNSLKIAF